ncbi:MAG: 50S ribosomal protein L29 [Methylicorpusculum sp.]|uniref:50S ribosomal protein L29 n=1 Tax=Methylicorpusculum sp. TaxID=2713644 RepID=UPI002726998E|nr:50S ribosomal protein L29 [Methylicorpusculum sp.]MDO8846483.1 50S ribosomal protein L29 [Methylicorpusculum sp.]MDO8939921.1 50S ribosomal protein L29 [Methylicorpusculum sp.]MDO9238391.1 50S ribosomal protein L29 [Methylicorpusculum sp.]MDP2180496.1 50S ribosomal protein L29 [Methylicorpusculum sp.]MDP2201307.1 50S ribosomal protein L29 [Methylicorpusculum sp.]
MKASELRQKTKDDLIAVLIELSKEQFNLRMQKGTGQLAKPNEIKRVRREIARVQTIINESASAAV